LSTRYFIRKKKMLKSGIRGAIEMKVIELQNITRPKLYEYPISKVKVSLKGSWLYLAFLL